MSGYEPWEKYRTSAELASYEADEKLIQSAVDEALANMTSLYVAARLNESQGTAEVWVDRTWDRLRERLTPEQRLHAILAFIAAKADKQAINIIAGLDGER